MAIRLCSADCSCRLLAHSEQRSTMAKPSVSWLVFGRAVCLVLGLLALPDIFPADSLCTCVAIRTGHCRRLVGFPTEGPLAFAANVLCRSPFEKGISWS